MESSIAVFLMRQHAFERLPTSVRVRAQLPCLVDGACSAACELLRQSKRRCAVRPGFHSCPSCQQRQARVRSRQ